MRIRSSSSWSSTRLVVNVLGNQDGTGLTRYVLRPFRHDDLCHVDPVSVTVREPVINNVNKQSVGTPTFAAGNPVTYTVTYSNTGTATAFEVRLLDILPAVFASVSVDAVTLTGGAAGVTNITAGTTVDVTIATVPVGGGVTVQYTGMLAVNVQQQIINTANVTYTSLPGTGTAGNPTGSNTPGPVRGRPTASGTASTALTRTTTWTATRRPSRPRRSVDHQDRRRASFGDSGHHH